MAAAPATAPLAKDTTVLLLPAAAGQAPTRQWLVHVLFVQLLCQEEVGAVVRMLQDPALDMLTCQEMGQVLVANKHSSQHCSAGQWAPHCILHECMHGIHSRTFPAHLCCGILALLQGHKLDRGVGHCQQHAGDCAHP